MNPSAAFTVQFCSTNISHVPVRCRALANRGGGARPSKAPSASEALVKARPCAAPGDQSVVCYDRSM